MAQPTLEATHATTLVFGWGNPSRGDDALGPLLIERLDALKLPHVACLTDFQLQVEHSLDLLGRERVLFVDASRDLAAPFRLTPLPPGRDPSLGSHAMSPAALLQICLDVHGTAPAAWLLAIRGEHFALGEPLSALARLALEAALDAATVWLHDAPGTPLATSGPAGDNRALLPRACP